MGIEIFENFLGNFGIKFGKFRFRFWLFNSVVYKLGIFILFGNMIVFIIVFELEFVV